MKKVTILDDSQNEIEVDIKSFYQHLKNITLQVNLSMKSGVIILQWTRNLEKKLNNYLIQIHKKYTNLFSIRYSLRIKEKK